MNNPGISKKYTTTNEVHYPPIFKLQCFPSLQSGRAVQAKLQHLQQHLLKAMKNLGACILYCDDIV